MKGDIKLFMLEFIQATAMTTVEILDELDYYSRGNWYARFRKLPRKLQKHKPLFEKQIAALKDRQRISKLIFSLKQDGLIRLKNGSEKWDVTSSGDKKIVSISNKKAVEPKYKVLSTNELKIIAFDVPESRRQHRVWLRSALKNLGFMMLQKSVWVGKSAVPEKFIYDLKRQGMVDFVDIFAVTKRGTLKQEL